MAPYGKTEVQFDDDSPLTVLQIIAEIHVYPLLIETAILGTYLRSGKDTVDLTKILAGVFTVQTVYFVYHRW